MATPAGTGIGRKVAIIAAFAIGVGSLATLIDAARVTVQGPPVMHLPEARLGDSVGYTQRAAELQSYAKFTIKSVNLTDIPGGKEPVLRIEEEIGSGEFAHIEYPFYDLVTGARYPGWQYWNMGGGDGRRFEFNATTASSPGRDWTFRLFAGRSFVLDQELDEKDRELFFRYAQSWFGLFAAPPERVTVAKRAIVDGHDSYALRGLISFDYYEWPDGATMPIRKRSDVPARVNVWISSDFAYPLLVQGFPEGDPDHGLFQYHLVAFQAGSKPVPWLEKRTSPFPPLAGSGAPGAPADGASSSLPLALGDARAYAEQDISLLRYRLWKQDHPTAALAGALFLDGAALGQDPPMPEWHLRFADKNGATYDVIVRKAPTNMAAEDVGEKGVLASYFPERLPQDPPTLSAAEGVLRVASGDERAPNFVRWGHAPEYPRYANRVPVDERLGSLEVGRIFSTGSGSPSLQGVLEIDCWNRSVRAYVEPASPEAPTIIHQNAVMIHAHSLAGTKTDGPSLQVAASTGAAVFLALLVLAFLPEIRLALLGAAWFVADRYNIGRGRALADDYRKTLLGIVAQNPEIEVRMLPRLSRRSWGAVAYHLWVLSQEKLVRTFFAGGRLCCSPVEAPKDAAPAA